MSSCTRTDDEQHRDSLAGRRVGVGGETGREQLMNVSGHGSKRKVHLGSCCQGYRLSSAPARTHSLTQTEAKPALPRCVSRRDAEGPAKLFLFFIFLKEAV